MVGETISHYKVLESFKGIFRDPPPGVSKRIENQVRLKSMGYDFPEPEILPFDALKAIPGAFTRAIEEVAPSEVDLPLELLCLDQTGISTPQAIIRRSNTGQWDKLTTTQATYPINPPAKQPRYQGRPRSATQLFE